MSKNQRKGIILAGGSGTRLYPLTSVFSKQLLPVYDKPMIYYSISTLMLAGIKDIALISTPDDTPRFNELLGDGSQWNINITYIVQKVPNGIAEAFILAEKFINNCSCALILGDNIFYGDNFINKLKKISKDYNQNTIFAYKVKDPERYGVVSFDNYGIASSIEEKPKKPISDYAVTGLYFYDNSVVNYAKSLQPSARGEIEITDLNKIYLDKNKLYVEVLGRGFSWLDAGTHDSLLEAGNFISTIENRHGLKIGCPEEIAFRNKWITEKQLRVISNKIQNNYAKYLLGLIE
jgi:glucose-1-phosphate thymidylyltransferase